MQEKSRGQTNMDWIIDFFVDEYHDLKITYKMRAGNTGYHSANAVVQNWDIDFTLDNLKMTAKADQIHMDQMMAIIRQLTETNKILGEKLKQLSEENVFG